MMPNVRLARGYQKNGESFTAIAECSWMVVLRGACFSVPYEKESPIHVKSGCRQSFQ
uniref:Uncharacterized protein n=1 Tax=mine drainage metagenome TaxID=410659 RepID=E6QDK0_9ZZZZ